MTFPAVMFVSGSGPGLGVATLVLLLTLESIR